MIDDQTKAFLSTLAQTLEDATSTFDLMLTCYLRGRVDQANAQADQSVDSYLRGRTDAAIATGAALPTAQPNKPRLVIVPDAQHKPTTH